MSTRRRLRLNYSSDEEEDEPRQHHNQQSSPDTDALMREAEAGIAAATLESTTPSPNPKYDFPSPPMEISDDDEEFVDVSDNLSPPSPEDPVPADAFQPPPSAGNLSPPFTEYSMPDEAVMQPPSDVAEEGSECLVNEFLKRLGLKVRSEWVTSCLRGLESCVPGFGSFSVDRKAELCFGQFLQSDMNYLGAGGFPDNVDAMHLVDLAGPFVLQVDEIVNISCPLRQRYHKAAPGNKRCLKLSMTDGINRVFGMEYRPIKDLDVSSPAGLKVAIQNVHVRHGLLMLVPEVCEVLGGMVEDLEAARQRLVTEIDKPPRGKRPRMGDIPPLATRATRAAWPSTIVNGREPNLNSRPHNSESVQTPIGVGAQGHPFTHRSNDSGRLRRMRGGGDGNQILHDDAQTSRREQHHRSGVIDIPHIPTRATPSICSSVGTSDSGPDHTFHYRPQHSNAEMTNADINIFGRAPSYFSDDVNRETTCFNSSSRTFINLDDNDVTEDNVVETDQFANLYGNIEDTHVDDEMEHPLMLSGDQEIPFTYLASLSAKLSAAEENIALVKGKIKCFLTGVKGFLYKDRNTYELRAYVDDGSLISEILIDHSSSAFSGGSNGIGYSPMEVNAAVSSSDVKVVSRMKEIIKQFRSFLTNFEGTMVVELKRSSPTPVAIEMNQGCPSSTAWLLLRRVNTYISVQTPQMLPNLESCFEGHAIRTNVFILPCLNNVVVSGGSWIPKESRGCGRRWLTVIHLIFSGGKTSLLGCSNGEASLDETALSKEVKTSTVLIV
ncbi:unnamed protein product [Rhodiola kirilowii]